MSAAAPATCGAAMLVPPSRKRKAVPPGTDIGVIKRSSVTHAFSTAHVFPEANDKTEADAW